MKIKFVDINVGDRIVDALDDQYEVAGRDNNSITILDNRSGNFLELTRDLTMKYVKGLIKGENEGIVCYGRQH